MGRHHGKYDRKARALFVDVAGDLQDAATAGLNQMIQVEQDFFRQFQKRIYIASPLTPGLDAGLAARLEGLWHAFCFDPDTAGNFLHESYQGTFGEGGQPDNRELELIHIKIGATTRQTNLVRLNIVTATVTADTAIVVYEYTWDFMDTEGRRVSETGQLHETWVRPTTAWLLLTDSGGPYA